MFLSSTAIDLTDFREQVVHVARRLGVDVAAMEDFGPDPRKAVELCREKVASADIFVGLYAHRYGFVPDVADGTSLTEMEYRWAMTRRPAPPVLLFMIDEDQAWPPKLIEHGTGWARLQAFKSELRDRHVVESLTTPEQLRDDLFAYLPRFLAGAPSSAEPVEHALPRPPEPFVVHPYSLLQTAGVVGRDAELNRLDRWLTTPGTPLMCVVAIGGMGKSAVTWRWFHHRPKSTSVGRFWWSFYEHNATFDRFVTTALAYCSGRSLAAVETVSSLDREQQLLAILDQQEVLLVLDGLERLLIAYSNLDFAHLSDDDLDERTANTVADHLGLPQGFVGRNRLRKTIDPRVGTFLRKLAGVRSGRVLITTRLFPSELQTDTGHALPGIDAWFLTGLQPEDAVTLWRALGASGADAELRELFATIDHYPLLIRALAGEIAHYRPAPGDLAHWRRDHPTFDPFTLPLVQAKTHVLAHAIGDLDERASELLYTFAAFRAPVEYATIDALFVAGRGWTTPELDAELTGLEDRGLVGWDQLANTYDLHPIVRGVVWAGLGTVRQKAVYGALEQHFAAVPASEEVLSPAGARPVIELFTALVGSDRHAEAAELFFDRLNHRFNFVRHGEGHLKIALLESLFPDGVAADPRVSSANRYRRFAVLAQLGHAYQAAGRLPEAYDCALRMVHGYQAEYEVPSLEAQALGFALERAFELGRVYRSLHQCRQAEAASKRAFPDQEEEGSPEPDENDSPDWGAEEHPDEDKEVSARHYAARSTQLEAHVGDPDQALVKLRALPTTKHFDPRTYEPAIRMLAGDVAGAAAEWERLEVVERDGHTGEMPLEYVEALILMDRLDGVIDRLTDDLRTARSCGDVDNEVHCLPVLALAHHRNGDIEAARECLSDFAEPAARGEYRYEQTRAAIILAEIEQAAGNHASAVAAATAAYRLAWCDGPRYSYRWSLNRAEKILRHLGVRPPDMSAPRGG